MYPLVEQRAREPRPHIHVPLLVVVRWSPIQGDCDVIFLPKRHPGIQTTTGQSITTIVTSSAVPALETIPALPPRDVVVCISFMFSLFGHTAGGIFPNAVFVHGQLLEGNECERCYPRVSTHHRQAFRCRLYHEAWRSGVRGSPLLTLYRVGADGVSLPNPPLPSSMRASGTLARSSHAEGSHRLRGCVSRACKGLLAPVCALANLV